MLNDTRALLASAEAAAASFGEDWEPPTRPSELDEFVRRVRELYSVDVPDQYNLRIVDGLDFDGLIIYGTKNSAHNPCASPLEFPVPGSYRPGPSQAIHIFRRNAEDRTEEGYLGSNKSRVHDSPRSRAPSYMADYDYLKPLIGLSNGESAFSPPERFLRGDLPVFDCGGNRFLVVRMGANSPETIYRDDGASDPLAENVEHLVRKLVADPGFYEIEV